MRSAAVMPFGEVVSQPSNRYIQDARAQGTKVVGFFCSYVPAELLHAAGVVPYRIKGVPDRDIGPGTTYLSSRICTFCRNTLSGALAGEYSFLDGIIGCNTCDQIRRTAQNWIVKRPPSFHDFIHVPRAGRSDNIAFYAGELAGLKARIEAWLGRTISDDDLASSIALYNRARRVLREISDLRKRDNPPLSGADMLTISLGFHQMPVERFIDAAEQLLESLQPPSRRAGSVRVVMTGSMIDEPDYVSFIEEQGLDVVADSVCFGQRSYMDDVDTSAPHLPAIAARSLAHFPCARIGDSFPERMSRILDIYRDYHADGIIFQRLKFCQLWGVDVHNSMPSCEEFDIPLLQLEREYGFFSSGQLKTRLQAFVELIEDRKASAS